MKFTQNFLLLLTAIFGFLTITHANPVIGSQSELAARGVGVETDNIVILQARDEAYNHIVQLIHAKHHNPEVGKVYGFLADTGLAGFFHKKLITIKMGKDKLEELIQQDASTTAPINGEFIPHCKNWEYRASEALEYLGEVHDLHCQEVLNKGKEWASKEKYHIFKNNCDNYAKCLFDQIKV